MRRLDRYRVDPEEEMAEPGFAPARPAPAVAALLRLQATAGNQATRRAVARATETAPPVKDRTAVFEGVGEYKVMSFSFDGRNEVALTIEAADTSRLLQLSQTGAPVKTVTIGSGGHALTLHEVMIAGFQQDQSGAITFQLNATSVDFK